MTVREQITDCFQNCRECGDNYKIEIDSAYSLFILVEKNPDCEDSALEYFIELNKTVDGGDEPCAMYNTSCPIDNLDDFEEEIIHYLEENGIYI